MPGYVPPPDFSCDYCGGISFCALWHVPPCRRCSQRLAAARLDAVLAVLARDGVPLTPTVFAEVQARLKKLEQRSGLAKPDALPASAEARKVPPEPTSRTLGLK